MAFEAKALRVQLPCGSVTVIDGEQYEAKVRARRHLQEIITPRLTSPTPCCARGTGEEDCIRTSGDVDIAAFTDRVCMGTDELEFRTVIHASALPELKRMLEAKLKEINAAQKAVERATRG